MSDKLDEIKEEEKRERDRSSKRRRRGIYLSKRIRRHNDYESIE